MRNQRTPIYLGIVLLAMAWGICIAGCRSNRERDDAPSASHPITIHLDPVTEEPPNVHRQ